MRWRLLGLFLAGLGGFVGCAGDDGDGDPNRDTESSGDNRRGSAPYQAACDSFCSLRQQAGCNSTETHADCLAACTRDGDLEVNCASEFTALVTCGTGAPMVCNGQIPRVSVDCSTQSSAYGRCLEANDWISISPVTCDVYSCQGICHIAFGCVECVENTDCAPTEECSIGGGVCRQRCLSDADCPGAFCALIGVCGDPVGTPCGGFSDCEGGSCIDVDANLTTVEPYCTVSCISAPCPEGYACQDSQCRRL